MSEEEANAYSKMEEEIKKEIMEDSMQTKSLPWMMFCTEQDKTKACAEAQWKHSDRGRVEERRDGLQHRVQIECTQATTNQR